MNKAYIGIGSLFVCALGACKPAAVHSPAPAAPSVVAVDPHAFRRRIPRSEVTRPVVYPVTERAQLTSGLRLYSVTKPSPTQSLSVVCRAGSSYDPPGRAGTAGLVARLLTEGTVRLDAEALAIAAERLGTTLSSSSTEEALSVQVEVLPEDADAALELLAEVIVQPGFRSTDFERVRREWLDDLDSERDDPSSLAALVARRALLGPKAGVGSFGNPAQVRSLGAEDVVEFHRAAIVPSRCAVSSAGPLSLDEMSTLVGARFGAWQTMSGAVERRAPVWPTKSRVLFVERDTAVQTAVFLASQTPGRKVQGHEARSVINGYFGGIFTSRLMSNLRERHAFTYGAFSRLNANSEFGVWSIETSVRSDVTQQAIVQLLLERQKLVDGTNPSSSEVQRAKAALVQGNNARLEHTGFLQGALHAEFINELPADYFATFGRVIEAFSPGELTAYVSPFAQPVSVLVLVGPAAALEGTQGFLDAPLERIDVSWMDRDE